MAAIQRATRADGIDALMDRHQLDAIVAPTMGPAWPTDHVLGDRLDGGSQRRAGGHRRLSRHLGADGPGRRPAGGHLVLRARVERADADPHRVRLRAGDEDAPAADLRGDARLECRGRGCPGPASR